MKKYDVWITALGIGIVNAILLRVFEVSVNDGTNILWNDLFRSDTYRWVVVPLAVVLSVALTFVVHKLGQRRLVPVETDLLKEKPTGPVTLKSIGVILAVGLACLLAGASLGPEAALTAASIAIGVWLANKAKLGPESQLLVLASTGALFVAFLGSMFMALVPLLVLLQRRKLGVVPVAVVLLASLSSYGTLRLIDPHNPGFGTAPPLPQLAEHDFIVALVIGFVTTLLALSLKQFIVVFARYAKRLNGRMPWALSAAGFGLGIGVLYLLGGQTIEFSGSGGSHMLVAQSARYGTITLLGIVMAKVLVTSWSMASGYRGGLVFPSLYTGVAFGLFIGHLHSEWGGAGAMIGGIAGMLSSVTGSPVMAGVFVLAVTPVKLVPLALIAIVGAAAGKSLLGRLVPHAREA